ncbi:MAG: SUMF1/EgtB/PvdO family nonheme iron enzyme [Pseudomonadota bacterium]|nr:SUMF1/EgtB/PvdO family nonheme iron enzyme [Pseudomonadota bacterium]
MLPLLLLACAVAPDPAHEPASPGCPEQMARIEGAGGAYCIHRFEVQVRGDLGDLDQRAIWPTLAARPTSLTAAAGTLPTSGSSWYQAKGSCEAMGWALCTSQQWEDACDGQPGPGGRAHPTADGTIGRDTCNIEHTLSKVQEPSGSYLACRTPDGVYDLEGNLWEWTDPGRQGEDGVPLADKRGGGHYSGRVARCDQAAIGVDSPSFSGTIGFRCCTPAL